MTFGEPLARGGSFLTGTTIRDCFTYEDLGPEDYQIAAAGTLVLISGGIDLWALA